MDEITPVEEEPLPPPTPQTPNRRKRTRRRRVEPPPYEEERRGRRFKECCAGGGAGSGMRWFIVVISLIGVGCSVSGGLIGMGGAGGREGFSLSLLMIGVGIVLLTVSAIAWKMTSPEENSETCAIWRGWGRICNWWGRRDELQQQQRYAAPSLSSSLFPPHPSTLHNLRGEQREPPPTYAASMQEYRLRLLLYERSNPTGFLNFYNNPPPPYGFGGVGQVGVVQGGQQRRFFHPHHSHPHFVPPYPLLLPYPPPLLHHQPHHPQPHPPISRPPSYTSRSSNTNLEEITVGTPTPTPPLPSNLPNAPSSNHGNHTRESSLLSDRPGTTTITVLHNADEDNKVIIVQTSESSSVNCQGGSNVFVTVNSVSCVVGGGVAGGGVGCECGGGRECFCKSGEEQGRVVLAHI